MSAVLMRVVCLAALLAASTFGCFAADKSKLNWPTVWQSQELRDHPLVGKIYVPATKTFLQPEMYLKLLAWPRFVLLGEIHDNPDHHALQALALKYVSGGKALSVVFEHFRSDQQAVLNAFQVGDKEKLTRGDDIVERLFLVTQWAKSGWPDKAKFRPLMAAVLGRNAKILAGNPPRQRLYQIAKSGTEALSDDAAKRLLIDRPLGGKLDDALLEELEASHCDLMPRSAFGGMAIAQRFRDGHMARVMVDATLKDGPVALVAGNGHVRLDRGVPWYVRRMLVKKNERPLVAVAHVEVVDGKYEPQAYLDVENQYSIVVFTPRWKRPDPCVEMRKRFGKHKKK